MELALADAGIEPSDVGHINAHGTSTPLNDLAEARAIAKVFGDPGPLVTSTKGVTGHGLAAAGAIEAVAAVLTIDRATIPPTAGYGEPDPEIAIRIVHGEPQPVGARRGAVELLRLRRPQRLPGAAAPWLNPAGKVAPPLPPVQRLVRSVDGKAANLGDAARHSRVFQVVAGVVVIALVAGGVVVATRSSPPTPTHAPKVLTRAVALGDSVPYGHGLANPYRTPQIGLPAPAVSQGPSTRGLPQPGGR